MGTGLPVHALGDPRMRIGRGYRKADRAQWCQNGQVIAHEGDLVQADAVLLAQRTYAGQLVADRDLGVDAQDGTTPLR